MIMRRNWKDKEIWEKVITHRRLQISAGKIEVESVDGNSDKYNGNAMSDGEKHGIFYTKMERMVV